VPRKISAYVVIGVRGRGAIHRPFKTPAVFAVAPLGAASAVFLMLGLPGDTWLRLVVWLAIGLAIYFLYGRNHSHLGRRQ
jgi:APA family basic amino acid/polyamine antiporter